MVWTIFGREVPLYGVMFVLGIGVAAVVAALIKKNRGIDAFDLVGSAVYTIILAMVGAKLLFILTSMDYVIYVFQAEGLTFIDKIYSLMQGGFVFYGGLIGGFFGLLIYVKQFKMKLFDFLDLYAVVLPLGHAFGRIGCFLGGCCYGIPYDGFLSYTYEYSSDIYTPIGVPLFPVQLVEATCLFLIFAGLMFVYFKVDKNKHLPVFVYAASYCVVRFVLEFLRGDKERGVALLSTSQWISLAIALFAAGYIVYTKFIKKPALAEAVSDEAPATEAEPAEEKTEA